MVYDDRGGFIGDAHWQGSGSSGGGDDGEVFEEGLELGLDRGSAIVQVGECMGSKEQDLTELLDKRAREVEKRRAVVASRTGMGNQNAVGAANSMTMNLTTNATTTSNNTPNSTTAAMVTPARSARLPRQDIIGGGGGPQRSHFLPLHRPLTELVTSPGPIGRAAIPDRSPFEARRATAAEHGDDTSRQQQLPPDAPPTVPATTTTTTATTTARAPPAKRRRLDDSPPSKAGHAQSLFGTRLTLSTGSMPYTSTVRAAGVLRERTNVIQPEYRVKQGQPKSAVNRSRQIEEEEEVEEDETKEEDVIEVLREKRDVPRPEHRVKPVQPKPAVNCPRQIEEEDDDENEDEVLREERNVPQPVRQVKQVQHKPAINRSRQIKEEEDEEEDEVVEVVEVPSSLPHPVAVATAASPHTSQQDTPHNITPRAASRASSALQKLRESGESRARVAKTSRALDLHDDDRSKRQGSRRSTSPRASPPPPSPQQPKRPAGITKSVEKDGASGPAVNTADQPPTKVSHRTRRDETRRKRADVDGDDSVSPPVKQSRRLAAERETSACSAMSDAQQRSSLEEVTEKRTELRIKPRQRRGLLMVSEKKDIPLKKENYSKEPLTTRLESDEPLVPHKSPKKRKVDKSRQCDASSTVATTSAPAKSLQKDVDSDCDIISVHKRKRDANKGSDAERIPKSRSNSRSGSEDDDPPKTAGARSRLRTNPFMSDNESDTSVEKSKTAGICCAATKTHRGHETKRLEQTRQRANQRRGAQQDESKDQDDEDKKEEKVEEEEDDDDAKPQKRSNPKRRTRAASAAVVEAPSRQASEEAREAPRITRMARKSVRSKEIIGYVVPEDNMVPTPMASATGRIGANHVTEAPSNHGHGHMHSTTTITPSSPGEEVVVVVATSTEASQNNAVNHAATRQIVGKIPLGSDEGQQQHQHQHQHQPPPPPLSRENSIPKKLTNPATRGRKAAKKEDAAGQVPQSIVPFDAVVVKPRVGAPTTAAVPALVKRDSGEEKSKGPGSGSGLGAAAGFTKANGGAWSKHAGDLLGMDRPMGKVSRR